jgi:hypothetical protein
MADWKAARIALEKSMQLGKGGNSGDWFFLAMTAWQEDNKEEARTWYDKAVRWMEQNAPRNEELQRFRAEAAALLGIKVKTTEDRRLPSVEAIAR